MNQKLPFNPTWFRNVLHEILPRWVEHAVTEEGLFLPQLDRQWRRYGDGFGTVVSQMRLLYNFAQGYQLTHDSVYRDAIEEGTAFFLEKFRDPLHGGWFHAVGPGGRVVDDRKDAYDLAFVIFGLSHVCSATGNANAKSGIVEAWELLQNRFSDKKGGYVRRMTRDFRENEDRRTQNPLMHLFEALLAAADLLPEMLDEAKALGRFVLEHLVHRSSLCRLPEYYTKQWNELPASEGGCVSIGHQFEWAFLLSIGVERGLSTEWLSEASALMRFGLEYGYDAAEGGIITSTTSEGLPVSCKKGWWEQCELVRALLHHAVLRGKTELLPFFHQTMDFVSKRYRDPLYGGWYENADTVPTASEPMKGGPFKADYHVVGMCTEALRLARLIESGSGV
ncbi:MAG: AGE family epimerase/isomerase [Kiritimatiellia bacterium]